MIECNLNLMRKEDRFAGNTVFDKCFVTVTWGCHYNITMCNKVIRSSAFSFSVSKQHTATYVHTNDHSTSKYVALIKTSLEAIISVNNWTFDLNCFCAEITWLDYSQNVLMSGPVRMAAIYQTIFSSNYVYICLVY